jgi:enoyl-CoA hydratase
VQSPTGGREHAVTGQQVLDLIEQMGKPVIAAINGYALGGGCELAMACTIRIAADTAKLGQPEINLGLIPGYAGTQRLARIVGKGRALELLLSGEQVTALDAYRLGLVNRVVAAADLMADAKKLAASLAAKAPVAVRYILEAVNKGLEMPFAQAQIFEATLFGLVASTDDMREGTAAFLEKRKAVQGTLKHGEAGCAGAPRWRRVTVPSQRSLRGSEGRTQPPNKAHKSAPVQTEVCVK